MSLEIHCPFCSGYGEDREGHDPCRKCGGKGFYLEGGETSQQTTPAEALDLAVALFMTMQERVKRVMSEACVGEGEVHCQEGTCFVKLYNWYPADILDRLKVAVRGVVPVGTVVTVEC